MNNYDDIINEPMPKLIKPRMSLEARSAQFAPYAALVGYGDAIAETAIASGAKVILSGTNWNKLNDCCNKLGVNSKPLQINLNETKSIYISIENAKTLFTEQRIDVLVNAAGIHGDWDFNNPDENLFDNVMNVNVKGMYFVSNAVARHMIENKIKGHILNVSSSSALRPAWTPYQISKWAVNGITRGLADYLLPYGIIVNGLAPGPTATKMVKKDDEKNIKASLLGCP